MLLKHVLLYAMFTWNTAACRCYTIKGDDVWNPRKVPFESIVADIIRTGCDEFEIINTKIKSLCGIERVGKLTKITLFDNPEMDEISPALGDMSNLTELSVSGSPLLMDSIMRIIKNGGFRNLQTLCLNDNNLDSLPPELANLQKLATLDISCNQFTCLSDAIQQLPSLKSLTIEFNSKTITLPRWIVPLLKRLTLLSFFNTELAEDSSNNHVSLEEFLNAPHFDCEVYTADRMPGGLEFELE